MLQENWDYPALIGRFKTQVEPQIEHVEFGEIRSTLRSRDGQLATKITHPLAPELSCLRRGLSGKHFTRRATVPAPLEAPSTCVQMSTCKPQLLCGKQLPFSGLAQAQARRSIHQPVRQETCCHPGTDSGFISGCNGEILRLDS